VQRQRQQQHSTQFDPSVYSIDLVLLFVGDLHHDVTYNSNT